jgi:hypothetical protein
MAVLKIRDSSNSSWIDVGGIGTVYQSDSAPASPEPGLMWLDTSSEGAGTTNIIPGYVGRSEFIYKDADEVTVGPGVYHHNGTTEQMVYWSADLDVTVTATSGYNYLYIDDSAVVTLGSDELTASELLFSTTAPTWSDAKHGWYNGSDRCISATGLSSASTQREFFHDGGRCVILADHFTSFNAADVDTTWVDVTLKIPEFCTQAIFSLHNVLIPNATQRDWFWRTNGYSGTPGNMLMHQAADFNSNTLRVHTDSSLKIEIRCSVGDASQVEGFTHGWYFPRGM